MLFEHLGLFDLHWWYLIHFWPVIIILWGVTILPIKNNIKIIISAAIVIITIISMAYISEKRPDFFNNRHHIYFHHQNDDEDDWDEPYFDSDTSTTDI
jgi:hypothetical protein